MYCFYNYLFSPSCGFDACCVPPMEDLKKCMLVRKITVGKDLVETPQREEQAKAARDSLSSLERQSDPVGPCKNYKCWEKNGRRNMAKLLVTLLVHLWYLRISTD